MRFRLLALALLSALSVPAFAAEEAAEAPKVKWVLPWKAGTALTYEMEDLESQETPGKKSSHRTTSTTHVAIAEANDDGFLQTWKFEDSKIEVLEGDEMTRQMMAQLEASARALENVALEVKLDREGMYTGLRNLDTVTQQLRELMTPVMTLAGEAELAKIKDEKARQAAREKAKPAVQAMMETLLAPAMVEGMVTRRIQDYLGFHGLELEPDQAYEVDTELPNPLGGAAFPAKLQFSMSVADDEPDDLYVSYDLVIDPEKVAAAAKDVVTRIAGKDAGIAKDAIQGVEVGDEGLFVVHRPTGVVEMFETTRTTKTEGLKKVERHRMRLVDNEHGHYWKDAGEAADAGADAEEG